MRIVLVTALAALLVGCATPLTRIERNPEAFAKLPPEQQQKVQAGEVGIGFDATAVRLAVGEPDRIAQRETVEGRTEVWTYYQPYTNVNAGFCPGYDFYGYYPSRHGYYRGSPHLYPGYFGSTTCFINQTVFEERLRLTFRDGKVMTVDRQLP